MTIRDFIVIAPKALPIYRSAIPQHGRGMI